MDHSIDHTLTYVKPILMNTIIDKDQRASIACKYSKTITQYKFDLMALNIDTLQHIIRRYQQSLKELHVQLYETCNQSLIEAVENRLQAMRERHHVYLNYKLQTFFDDAPMAIHD